MRQSKNSSEMLIYKYYIQQENEMAKAREGDGFKKKGVASKIKFLEVNLRTETKEWNSTGDFEEAVLVEGLGIQSQIARG